jgi:hypothetical protein
MDGSGQARTERQIPDIDALPAAAMVSQYEAARYLGVSAAKVGWLVYREYLKGSRYGVTVGSLQREKQWRAAVSRRQKIKRCLRGVGHFFREFLLEALNPLNWF